MPQRLFLKKKKNTLHIGHHKVKYTLPREHSSKSCAEITDQNSTQRQNNDDIHLLCMAEEYCCHRIE